MENGSMWALIRHDMKLRAGRRSKLPRAWKMVYLAIALIVVIVVTTHESANSQMILNNVWFFTFGFPFMVFGMSSGMAGREWRNGTVEWWLTLPMSRPRLVTAKVIATILRSLIIFATAYIVVSILGIYTQLLHGNGLGHDVSQFLLAGLKWMGLVAAVTPLAGALGILFAILRHSRARPALPLIWVLYGALWWFGISYGSHWLHRFGPQGTSINHVTPVLWCAFVASWLVTIVIVRLASYLLDRQLAM